MVVTELNTPVLVADGYRPYVMETDFVNPHHMGTMWVRDVDKGSAIVDCVEVWINRYDNKTDWYVLQHMVRSGVTWLTRVEEGKDAWYLAGDKCGYGLTPEPEC